MEPIFEEEATFTHPIYNTELNVVFDGTHIYMTFYGMDQKPATKIVLKLSEESKDIVSEILEDYQRKA